MTADSSETRQWLERLADGDPQAVAALFACHRGRLKRMIQLRLDHRLQGRLDASDVLQEAYLDVARRAADYAANPTMPVFLWLRWLTGQKLLALHRHHLGTGKRNATRDVSIHGGALPPASSASLATCLVGRLTTPSQAAVRAELQQRLHAALNGMEALDREVLVLRHFEQLTNGETAQVLGLQKAAASNRYVRALGRLKEVLAALPGFFDEPT